MLKSLRQIFIYLLLGAFFISIQAGLRNIFSPYEVLIPNIFISLVVYLGFHEINLLGAAAAFLLGLELDLASGITFGPWAAAYVALFGAQALVAKRIFIESYFTLAITVFCSTIFVNLIYFALVFNFSNTSGRTITSITLEALITAVIAPLIILSFGRRARKLRISRIHAHR